MIRPLALITLLFSLLILCSTVHVSAQTSETQKYVIFRDDDVAPGARYGDILKAVNQIHMDTNVPVTLGIIPHPSRVVPHVHVHRHRAWKLVAETIPNLPGELTDVHVHRHRAWKLVQTFPDNGEGNQLLWDTDFFNYMRSISANPLFEFAQHGYTHRANDLAWDHAHVTSEFFGEPYAVQYEAIKRGRDDIRQAFGVTPTTFIPPWNRGDYNTFRAAKALGFKQYCTGTLDYYALHGRTRGVLLERNDVTLGGMTDASFRMSVESAILKTEGFMNDPKNSGGTLVVMYHFWAFQTPDGSIDKEKLALLRAYIDYLKSRGDVLFTRVDRAYVAGDVTAPSPSIAAASPSIAAAKPFEGTALNTLAGGPFRLLAVGGSTIVLLLGIGVWFVAWYKRGAGPGE